MDDHEKVDLDCDCDSCKMGRLFIEFKRKGADPVVLLAVVGEVLSVLYGVEIFTRKMDVHLEDPEVLH